MMTVQNSGQTRLDFLDRAERLDMNTLTAPFMGVVEDIINGPEGVYGPAVVFNYVPEISCGACISCLSSIRGQLQIVVADGQFYTRQDKGDHKGLGQWSLAGTSDDAGGQVSGDVASLQNRLSQLEAQVQGLKQTDVESVAPDGTASVNSPDKDVVVTAGTTPLSGKSEVKAKSIEVKSVQVESGILKLTATEDISINGASLSGTADKATLGNTQVAVNSGGFVRITASDFAQSGYNAVEIGLNSVPKGVYIDGLDFTGALNNNAINIFAFADGAEITISNCHFTKVSNAIRLSNNGVARAKFNIINCAVDEWDSRIPWVGFMIMQEYKLGSVDAVLEKKPFGADKISITMTNCKGPGGKLIKPTDLSSVCGTSDANQLFYVYCGYNSVDTVFPYSEDMYPKFTFN